MEAIIDRFEGKYAVCERQSDKKMIEIKKNKLPDEATEGDYLIIKDEKITIDSKKTMERKKRIRNLMNDLWED